jgi:hypothetical protein
VRSEGNYKLGQVNGSFVNDVHYTSLGKDYLTAMLVDSKAVVEESNGLLG